MSKGLEIMPTIAKRTVPIEHNVRYSPESGH